MGIFCEQRRKARAKEVFMRKNGFEWSSQRFLLMKFFIREKGVFLAHAKLTDKEKLFLSAPRQQLPTATKLTRSNPFRNRLLLWACTTIILFRKTSVLCLHYGNPFAPIQSLHAGVLRAKPVSARAAGKLCKITSGRALNRSPESRGSQTSGVLFGTFCTTQKERKTVPFAGSSEVLQTLNQLTQTTTSHKTN